MPNPAFIAALFKAPFVNFVLVIATCLLPDHARPQAGAVKHRIVLGDRAPATLAAPSSVQFIGTATVLIRHLGLTILTDPNFLHKGQRVLLGYGLHAERLTEPALQLSHLPPIDLVVLSHFHEDHFDKFVQQQLDRNTLIVTTRHEADKLQGAGFRRARALATWE